MADNTEVRPGPPPVRLPTPRSANEVFGALYGTNVSASAMIQAFSSIRMRFRFRAGAIFLRDNDHFARFDLPARYRVGRWEPPSPMSEVDLQEMEDLYQALTNGRSESSQSIVDLAHRVVGTNDTGETQWALLFSCTMRPAELSASKRTTGDIKILLHNEGHQGGCIYKKAVSPEIMTRSAVEDHDLIAVYAAYFDQMLRDLSFVPMALIQAEWNKALNHESHATDGEARHRAGLPWGLQAPPETPTITVSLDLRKSTFAMQQTRDRRAYAHWLEGVAELARTIILQNGGIFDKFTGDGVICHFVYPAGSNGESSAEADAIQAAMICAAELVHAMQLHIGNVISLLKFKSRAFGPAVGMAVDMAAWSLDRDGKPVVVGPGIVNACRLNGGKAGDIILTNDLKERLAALLVNLRFDEHVLGNTHKEFVAALEATCWRVSGNRMRLGRSTTEIQAEVDRVWRDIQRAS